MPNEQAFKDLLDVLSKVDENKFSMSVWKCNTAACAMGYAAMDERFRARGLRLSEPESNGHCEIYNSVTNAPGQWACMEIMDISIQDVWELFTGNDACHRTLEEEIIWLKHYCRQNNISLEKP